MAACYERLANFVDKAAKRRHLDDSQNRRHGAPDRKRSSGAVFHIAFSSH
jgi:hypothetical protein